MDAIRRAYGSSPSSASPSSDSEGDSLDHGDHGDHLRVRSAVAGVTVIAQSLERPAYSTTRRSRPLLLDDDQAFNFRAYQSKRRRRQRSSSPTPPSQHAKPLAPVFTDLEEIDATDRIRQPDNEENAANGVKLLRVRQFPLHAKTVRSLQWSARFPQLFLSAAADGSVRVWHIDEPSATRRDLQHHSKGVASAKWSLDGRRVLSGGFDGLALVTDVETSDIVHRISTGANDPVTTVSVHPTDPNWVALGVGINRGAVHCMDLRQPQDRPAFVLKRGFAHVHDLLFLDTGDRLVSSAGLGRRDASNQTLLVWDFRAGTLLADRLDDDLHAFSSLRLHPRRPIFAAQCTANYAALFSTVAPFKRLKAKHASPGQPRRSASFSGGHEVGGFPVQCSFRSDGAVFASGDAAGCVVLYGANSAKRPVLNRLQLYDARTPCLAAEFHPAGGEYSRLMLAGSSNGAIELLECCNR